MTIPGIPDLHVFNIILTVISTVGLAGAVVLAIFAPAAAEAVLQVIVKIMTAVLSTRIGVGFVVGALCLIVGELEGTHQANVKCRAAIVTAEKQADAAANQRDDQQATIRSAEDQDYITKLETLNKTNEDKINGYDQALADRKSTVCALSADDLQRMRN